MSRHAWWTPLFVLALAAGGASDALAQALELAVRGPRFIAAWAAPGKVVEVDVSKASVLRRRVSLDLTNVTADEALKEITRQADLEISYSKALLPSSRSVSLHAREITVAAALTEVLLDAGVDVAVGRGGHMALLKRLASETAEVQVVDSGDVAGRVTDKATGAPIAGATVIIEGTGHSATTESDGGYRIVGIPSGTYRVIARYIGYAPLVTSVTVNAGGDAKADFALEKSAQKLDELVTVTPGGMQTQVKTLPSPISIVTAADIERQRAANAERCLSSIDAFGCGIRAAGRVSRNWLRSSGGEHIGRGHRTGQNLGGRSPGRGIRYKSDRPGEYRARRSDPGPTSGDSLRARRGRRSNSDLY